MYYIAINGALHTTLRYLQVFDGEHVMPSARVPPQRGVPASPGASTRAPCPAPRRGSPAWPGTARTRSSGSRSRSRLQTSSARPRSPETAKPAAAELCQRRTCVESCQKSKPAAASMTAVPLAMANQSAEPQKSALRNCQMLAHTSPLG